MKAGAVAKITSWPAELVKSVLLSKAAYHVPIVVGAVPFDLKISLGFSFIPAFTSKNSVVEGSKLIKYSGSGGFNFSNGKTSPSGSLNVEGNVAQHDTRVLAVGPVGFTAATEAPRLELTLGWPPMTALVAGYLNFVASYGIVTNGMASPVPCQTNIMAFSVTAGVYLQLTQHFRHLAGNGSIFFCLSLVEDHKIRGRRWSHVSQLRYLWNSNRPLTRKRSAGFPSNKQPSHRCN